MTSVCNAIMTASELQVC